MDIQSARRGSSLSAPLLLARPHHSGSSRRRCCRSLWPPPVWCEWPLRLLCLLCLLVLGLGAIVPFFFVMRANVAAIWDTILDDWGPYLIPIGFEASLLSVITLLVGVAGAIEHTHKRPPCSMRVAGALIHLCNVGPLVALAIWWWPGWAEVKVGEGFSDLMEGMSYISAMCCKMMMGLCLLPIARQSLWLNAAAVGFPEAISFHRVTGWWCVGQVLLHGLAEVAAVMSEAASEADGPTAVVRNRPAQMTKTPRRPTDKRPAPIWTG